MLLNIPALWGPSEFGLLFGLNISLSTGCSFVYIIFGFQQGAPCFPSKNFQVSCFNHYSLFCYQLAGEPLTLSVWADHWGSVYVNCILYWCFLRGYLQCCNVVLSFDIHCSLCSRSPCPQRCFLWTAGPLGDFSVMSFILRLRVHCLSNVPFGVVCRFILLFSFPCQYPPSDHL